MSTVSQGPGWWLASDGMWYPPVQSPGGVAQNPSTPSDPSVAPGQGQLPTFPGYVPTSGAPGYGPPPASPGYGPQPASPGYAYPSGYPPYSYAEIQKTNGLAVASLVCSLFFWLYGLGALLGIVFGFIARSQIKHSGGWQKGKGLALAGIIISFAGLVIGAVVITIAVVLVRRHCHTTGSCTFNTTVNSGN